MVVSWGDRLGRGWRNVHRGDPCEICGKGDWCSRSLDRSWAICRRVDAGGERRLDRAGAEYWLHALGTTRRPAPALPEPVHRERACSADLDRVYSALLRHLPLEARHGEMLNARGLDAGAIEAGGYRSLPRQGRGRAITKLEGIFGQDLLLSVPGFFLNDGARGAYLSLAGPPGMLVPVRDASGRVLALKVRRDDPGNGPKYLYVSSTARGGAGPGAPVHVPLSSAPSSQLGVVRVTEGELKADVATQLSGVLTISVPGVSAWRGVLPVLAGLSPRQVQLAFDADAATNPIVARAAEETAVAMAHEGYEVIVEQWDGMLAKGVDDALVRGVPIRKAPLGSTNSHDAAARKRADKRPASSTYQSTPEGLVWSRQTASGPVTVKLTNFEARIAAEVLEDDGAEVRRRFEIETSLNGAPRRFIVGAEAFASMGWVMEQLGARALVYPGFGLRDHARAAMQILSADVPERRVFAHTGWRKLAGSWVYLHGGGALGASGLVSGVDVALPDTLSGFTLPEPPSPEVLMQAVKASLRVLDAAPDRVTVPLVGAIYRAALGNTDFALHMTGPTGAGKSELAALAQRHFGKDMDARHLPGSWASTANALEAIAFVAKDALLVVDDFAPLGSEAKAAERAHADADRLLRAQGNRSGRLRMRSDSTLQVSRPPRGLILSTGEDLPRGQSLRSRLLACELGPTDVDWAILTTCQDLAAAGAFSQALAAFLVWVANHHDTVLATLRQATLDLRRLGADARNHRRTPEILANLGAALGLFLDFARRSGALNDTEQERLWSRVWAALSEASYLQGQHQTGSEPAQRFLDLLGSVLASGRAHLAAPGGGRPSGEEPWGWRAQDGRIEAKGERIGWVDGDHVYLDPDAAYAAVQRLGDEVGDRLNLTPQTLRKRLKEQGILRSSDGPRRMLTIRRTLDGTRREVLHLSRDALSCPSEGAAQEGVDAGEDGGWLANGEVPVGSWSAYATSKTGLSPAETPRLVGLVGSSGPESRTS